MRALTSLVDWRRTAVLLPFLAVVGVAIYFFGLRDSTSDTPRAMLLRTTAPGDASVGTKKGQLARDFQATAPDGEIVRLSALRGRPTVMNFWATWCASCVAELPDLRDLQTEVGADHLNVLAVNVGESSGAARKFLNQLDVPGFRVGMDPSLVVADAFGVRGMPQSFFLDARGFIRATYVGQLKPDIMRDYVRAASAGADAVEIRGPLRLITTVARDHVLEVETLGSGRIEFRSKSLRCDDSYCAKPAIDAFVRSAAVELAEEHLDSDPPAVVVTFDERTTSTRDLASQFAANVVSLDLLYERPITIEYK
jgi:peroxiredoxin